MRKYVAAAVAPLILSSAVLAAGNHPMAGCGLGYLLLSNKDNEKVTQVIGATTNGTFGSQTFGISSGTSGCTSDGAVKLAREVEAYTEVNFASLRREMAEGRGEYVTTLAAMLGASDTKRADMVAMFQREYAVLFPTDATTASEMLTTLASKLSAHPELVG